MILVRKILIQTGICVPLAIGIRRMYEEVVEPTVIRSGKIGGRQEVVEYFDPRRAKPVRRNDVPRKLLRTETKTAKHHCRVVDWNLLPCEGVDQSGKVHGTIGQELHLVLGLRE